MTISTFRFKLDTTSRKFKCPLCGRKRFVKYCDSEKNDFISDEVGKCDRESSCGYHYPPKKYFIDKGFDSPKSSYNFKPQIEQQPIDYMTFDFVVKSMSDFETSNFAAYLISLFGDTFTKKLLLKYYVGRSKKDNGKANIFWRIDIDRKVRSGKIMFYNPITGKRDKLQTPTWTHVQRKPFNHHLCFFGEHLLSEYPNSSVGIVESEKTAIIASIYFPDIIWIATGGVSGCKWREYSVYKVLKNRNVVLYPDFGFYNKVKAITCFQEWSERAKTITEKINCTITVSSLLENRLDESLRVNDFDLADFLVKRDEHTGIAMTDYNYPIMWDFN